MKTSSLILHALMLACCGSLALAQTVTISATDASAAETPAGQPANPGSIRIARTGATASPLTVWVKVSGVAVQSVDYTFGSNIGTFVIVPAGSAALDIPVNVIDDFLTEGTEDVRIRLDTEAGVAGTPVPYTIGGSGRATVNIADDEDPLAAPRAIVTVAAVDATATETAGGTDPAVFRITRTNNLSPALTILYSLGGTATPGVDYTTPPATITIPAGVASVDVPIAPIDDPLIELAETVTFTILPTNVTGVPSPAEAYVIGVPGSASATIISNDVPSVTITNPGPNAAAASGQPRTVNFTASDAEGYIVSYAILIDGTVAASGVTNLPASTVAGTPYLGTATVTFVGSNGFAHLSVRVTDDQGVSATSAVTNVYVFVPPPDPPQPPVLPHINIYALDAEGAEVASGSPNIASFRVTHDFPPTATVSFLYAIGGTARPGVDYTLSTSGALGSSFLGNWFTFPAGTTEAIFEVTPIDDLLIENTETVTMSLYTPPFIGFCECGFNGFSPGEFGFYYGPNYTATVNILDDDITPPPFPVVKIAATDPSGTETVDGSDPIVFTITRTSGPTDVPLTVHYSLPRAIAYSLTAPSVAVNGADYPTLSGAVTIPAGATSTDIVVVPTYDRVSEGNELLYLSLLPSATVWPDPAAYVLDTNIVATAAIRDAVLAPGTSTVWIRVVDALCFEENLSGRIGVFSVERDGNFTNPLTVTYSISGTATNGVDYATLPGTATIPAGSPRISIVIDPILDTITEIGETVGITIEPPSLAVSPPPYVVGSTSLRPRSAGIRIYDQRPFDPRARAFYARRGRHTIIPLPVTPAPAPAPPASGAVATTAAAMWSVEASTDLINWETIGTTDPSGEQGDFVDVNAGDYDQRYYRFRPITTTLP